VKDVHERLHDDVIILTIIHGTCIECTDKKYLHDSKCYYECPLRTVPQNVSNTTGLKIAAIGLELGINPTYT